MKYCISIPEELNDQLNTHLIREDRQEDLCFALYSIGKGNERTIGIINKIILPEIGDRNIHGNASFNPKFLDKVTKLALQKKLGIVFIHSHPGSGWQNMSRDDIKAEKMLAPRIKAITNLPLIGMTIGNNGDWSARFWNKIGPKKYRRDWCEVVKTVGENYKVTYYDKLLPPPVFDTKFVRTISAWGQHQQEKLSRIRVGIVGIGSVGSQICEALIRTGIQNITMIDYDLIEEKNLDRLHSVNKSDIGNLKADTYKKYLDMNKLYKSQFIKSVPYSIFEKEGYESAIDCDIIFCCVDKPLPRHTLNCISFLYLIPVIDGGIYASYSKKRNNIDYAMWRTFITTHKRRCMKCMEQYKPEDVSLQQSGLLNDPEYIKGLDENHFIKKGENVYAFSLSLASMQVQQFLSFVLKPKGAPYWPKEMDFNTGNITSNNFKFHCDDNCEMIELLGLGNVLKNTLIQKDVSAENSRMMAIRNKDKFWRKVTSLFTRFR